jgi:DNA-binding NarL/FixJ family response regulator
MTSVLKVLVVEDHELFRRALCELLRERADVVIVGEAADGLEAVRQAEALLPDVVTLDVGLPTLDGLAVAERIRAVVPDARLLFVTVECSLEVVERAFRNGAHGYVYKPRAQRDVLPVLEAIIRGGRFVSGGLERIARGDSLAAHRHHLVFYSSDAVLVSACSRFIAGQLGEGNSVVALLTEAHDAGIRRRLQASHLDLGRAIRQEQYVPVKISDLLARVMVNGWPDTARFLEAAEELVTAAARRATGQHARLAACGECAPTLWAQGHAGAAVQLEHLWDEFASSREIDLLCLYPLTARDEHVQTVRGLCAEHTTVEMS